MKSLFALLLCLILGIAEINAQVTSIPTPLQEYSENVVIYYDASQGNGGLKGLKPPTKIYAHTGVTTSNGTWQYIVAPWGQNLDKCELTYVSENLWQLYIGDIRTFYGISDPSVTVKQLDFVFRTADGSKEGKTVGGGDIFLDVVDTGLQIELSSNPSSNIILVGNTQVTFTVSTTMSANITLSVNGTIVADQNAVNTLSTVYNFVEPGDYEVTATATAGTTSVSVSKEFVYLSDPEMVAYPGMEAGVDTPPMGPVANNDGTVTFCLAAPEKSSVMILGAWNDYKYTASQQMSYTTDANGFKYFWWTSPQLDRSTMYGYCFLIDGTTIVGDPYARLVQDPWNDKDMITGVEWNLPPYPFDKIGVNIPLAIYQGSINDYKWEVPDFKSAPQTDLIIYELLLRDFTGTEGAALGNGTVQQAMAKIPYLSSLGINAIELLPINEFEGNQSWGYNPNFYFAPDKAYGTPQDYKAFIDECHKNGIAVILDMVFNQSDGLHPWYVMYGGIMDSPFYNYGYGGENGAPHAYSVLNDWNQDYPLVQQQWKDVLEYWLTEYNVDGFRFDLVKGLGNDDSYANASPAATDAYNQSRVDRMKTLQDIVCEIKTNAYFINENLAGAQEENAMAASGQMNWAKVNYAGCQFAMGYDDGSNLNRVYAPYDDRTWGSTVSYLESHDEQRLAFKQNKWGATGVKGNHAVSMQRLGSAAAQLIMAPGAHMIWQFSEMGNAENTKGNGGNDENINLTDNKTVNWDLLKNPDNYGLYMSYCELIRVRTNASNRKLFDEDASFTIECDVNNWNNGRVLHSVSADRTMEAITVINPNISRSINFNVSFEVSKDNSAYSIASKSYNSNPSFNASTGTVTVPANCYVTLVSNNVTDLEEISGEYSDKNSSIEASAQGGILTIMRTTGPVSVYTLDGVLLARLNVDESIAVSKGVYILNNGNETVKIVAR